MIHHRCNPSKIFVDTSLASTSADAHMTNDEVEISPPTPRKLLRQAIVKAISPGEGPTTSKALNQNKQRRARVQKKYGECLTEEESLERLKAEEIKRGQKKARGLNESP